MNSAYSRKMCALAAIALFTAATTTSVSAEPGENSEVSSTVLRSPLSAAGSARPAVSMTGNFTSKAPLSAAADLDVVQQSIAEMTAEAANSIPTLQGLDERPATASLDDSVFSDQWHTRRVAGHGI